MRGPILALRRPMIPLSDENPTLHTPIMTWLHPRRHVRRLVRRSRAAASGHELQLVTSICNLGMVPGELTHRAPSGLPCRSRPGLPASSTATRSTSSRRSSRCFCTAAGATSSATRSSSGSSATTSRTAWGRAVPRVLPHLRLDRGRVHISLITASPVPTVGASGAISGVLGAYLVLYPKRARQHVLLFLSSSACSRFRRGSC